MNHQGKMLKNISSWGLFSTTCPTILYMLAACPDGNFRFQHILKRNKKIFKRKWKNFRSIFIFWWKLFFSGLFPPGNFPSGVACVWDALGRRAPFPRCREGRSRVRWWSSPGAHPWVTHGPHRGRNRLPLGEAPHQDAHPRPAFPVHVHGRGLGARHGFRPLEGKGEKIGFNTDNGD